MIDNVMLEGTFHSDDINYLREVDSEVFSKSHRSLRLSPAWLIG